MLLPSFDHEKQCWDAWLAFHVDLAPGGVFTQFDTDEVIVINRRWTPADRRLYRDLHVQVVSTSDHDCPRLFVPGSTRPVPKSHLNHAGQQILLLDHDHARAVSLDGGMTKSNGGMRIPERFTKRFTSADPDYGGLNAYYAGPTAAPLGAVPVVWHVPYQLTRTQRAHLGELRDACRVWRAMQPDSQVKLHDDARRLALPAPAFASTPFAALTAMQRLAVALRGFDLVERLTSDWLTF